MFDEGYVTKEELYTANSLIKNFVCVKIAKLKENDLMIHLILIFGNVIGCTKQWIWVGYLIYFTFTPAFF